MKLQTLSIMNGGKRIGIIYGYIRVFSTDQNEDRQLIALWEMVDHRKIRER